jgi:tetratricopeptide (TPR) repeat protein
MSLQPMTAEIDRGEPKKDPTLGQDELGQGAERASASAAADPKERIRDALRELAGLSGQQAEDVVLELLQAVQTGNLPLSTLLGYDDDDLYELYEKAYSLYDAGRPKNAMRVCQGLLALNSGVYAARMLLAACLTDLRQYGAALEEIEQVLSAVPEELEAHLKQAHIRYRQGQIEGAAGALMTLIEIDPGLESGEGQEAARLLEHIQARLADARSQPDPSPSITQHPTNNPRRDP